VCVNSELGEASDVHIYDRRFHLLDVFLHNGHQTFWKRWSDVSVSLGDRSRLVVAPIYTAW